MMDMSSTDRALTAKSLCQWTAATTLFAVGSLAFFSANTIEKLSQQGGVALDVEAFRKLGSVSVALDRTEEQRLILEEDRLIEKSAFAQAEVLPKPALKYSKNIGPAKARKNTRKVAKNRVRPTVAADGMTAAEKAEIAVLEKAPDPAVESAVLAKVYRRMRFQFVAAVDAADTREALIAQTEGYDPDRREYGEESVEIAQEIDALEYDEIPVYDASDFVLPADRRSDGMIAQVPPSAPEVASVETAPEPEERVVRDEIESTASATANPDIFSLDPLPPSGDEAPAVVGDADENEKSAAPVITSNGLDAVPMSEVVTTQVERSMTIQNAAPVRQTGPPERDAQPKIDLPASLATSSAQSTPSLDSIPEKTPSPTAKTSSTPAVELEVTADDQAEYAADLRSIYEDTSSDSDRSGDEYSADSEYSARPAKMAQSAKAQRSHDLARSKEKEEKAITVSSIAPSKKGDSARKEMGAQNLGNGVSRDSKGITIDWNSRSNSPIEVAQSGVGPGASSPNSHTDLSDSLKKFSFSTATSQSSAVVPASGETEKLPDPATDRCNTEKLGVEAFNPAAENETISVCRRPLSLEGSRDEKTARWWEAYGTEGTHWPTLIYQRGEEPAEEKNRIPLLPTTSIRILSTFSRVNTHTGMGIIFGEVPAGIEIRLVGRSDAPIYLDGGMKVRDSGAGTATKRQFVFLNVAPGQPLLSVNDSEKKRSGAIPMVVKAGIATYIRVPEPTEKDASFVVYDASSAKESRLSGITAEVVGQSGRVGISDRKGAIKIAKVVTFGAYPVYLDLVRSDKSYRNRYRLSPNEVSNHALFFFDEKRANGWISQLSGGVSPVSGMIVGIVPQSTYSSKEAAKDSTRANHLRIGTFEKKGSLVPERYLLGEDDQLVSDSKVRAGFSRFLAVQVPEGVAIPSVIDPKGELLWSEIVYAQPGVINVVGP